MQAPRDDSADREQQLNAILHDYLQAVDAGRAPNQEEILRLHPDLATELSAFFADQERMDRLARDMRSAGPAEAPDAAPLVRCIGDLELPEEITRSGFIQAGDVWTPDSGASDPFTLEYQDGISGKLYATTEPVTLEQVRSAFLDYFSGGDIWRQSHTWVEVSL